MFCKKNAVLFLTSILFALWGYFTYDVNRRFPNPENIKTEQNETVDYKGISITAKEIEIYRYEQLIEHYPQLESVYDLLGGEEKESNNCYYIVTVVMENRTKKIWNQGKESVVEWMLEVGEEYNGVDFFAFSELNWDYHKTMEPGESQEIKLPYSIREDYITLEEAVKEDKKIIYSYYPTKNYFFYPGE